MASEWSTNLKIELLGTGDTNWGDLTNNNFKWALEDSITGYVTATFPSDADYDWGALYTNSNSSQAQRNLVVQVAGTLTANRAFIVPTIEKQYIIWNNTSGSQAITVKTSAGTGVIIPNGFRMHVYVDGTNVVQMDNYDVSRTIGALSLTSALTVANGGIGTSSLAINNVLLGNGTSAVQVVAPGANGNVLTSNGTTWVSAASSAGSPAGSNTQLQYNNSGVFGASANLTFANSHLTVNSIKIGRGAGNDTYSTAVGTGTLNSVTTSTYNTMFGFNAGNYLSTGTQNIAIGVQAFSEVTDGNYNIAIGSNALKLGTSPIRNIIIGADAGYSVDGADNIAIGFDAYGTTTTGNFNTIIGALAGRNLSSGSTNVFIGYTAGSDSTSGSNTIILGYDAEASSATVSNEITLGNTSINKLRVPGISLTAGAKWINVSESTVGSLPSASTAGSGARAFVTDANATTFASIVAGSGSNKVPVYSDGTNWRIG